MNSYAAVEWTDRRDLQLVERKVEAPSDDEIAIAVESAGICGSDLHFLRGDFSPRPGTTPGHEFAGRVVAVGRHVSNHREGDLVGVEPLVRCGICEFCLTGDYHVCQDRRLVGEGQHGGMSQQVIVPAQIAYPVPRSVDAEGAALAEPLACSVHGFRKIGLQGHETVFIVGAGTIGLTAILAARAVGARVIVLARHPHQQAAASRLGAAEVLSEDEVSKKRIADLVAGNAIDVSVETVGGKAETLWQAQQVLRPKGKLIVLGVFTGGLVPINALHLAIKEIEMVGSMTYNAKDGHVDYEIALEVVGGFLAEVKSLVSHRFDLSSVNDAFRTAADKSTKSLKVHFNPNPI
ncbi:MAG: alcohol dehydrogenase catalytic domain-containing protein [Gammaproteobacteria bacterium]|nr:alcohol dehydrogenase catalytic domain-containing protein [Gammaproteobacteria bacterium]